MELKIGTRGSTLALCQSTWVKDRIESACPDVVVSLVKIKTKGDKILDSPLSAIGGKGLFVKEIEEALLRRDIDVAVHSLKDVPADIPEGLELAFFPPREDPRDAIISISGKYATLDDLPQGSSVGTGSLRRSSQILHRRPDLKIVPIRGNVGTRLKKLESEGLHAIILAVAGLHRLGLSRLAEHVLSTDDLLPAPGQGALALEMREEDTHLKEKFRFLHHEPTETAIRAERAFLKRLEGGCQVPIAAYGTLRGEQITLRGMVAELDGSRVIKDHVNGGRDRPESLGISLAEDILARGADEILARIYGKG
ncbi:MAG: hydroxymethylbilane synthase [Deltaproteobacteria bacterium]|nr:hydroxymethylbilane synthase [Deltaproteobacteria bacterium]MBW2138445.1 hydroxymethylbilane synthase [Deltaproteobacteria bacterium]